MGDATVGNATVGHAVDAAPGTEVPVDGRRARRERGRTAVIDAMLDLLQEGRVPPPVELVAERSGVSVSTIFRYFQGLDTLQVQTFERFLERFGPLITPCRAPDAPRSSRIAGFAAARLDLYEQAGTIMAVGRLRSLEHEPLVGATSRMRGLLAEQARSWFATEMRAAPGAASADLAPAVDAFTSLEAWDVMRRTHSRSRSQIDSTWQRGLAALCDTWNEGENR